MTKRARAALGFALVLAALGAGALLEQRAGGVERLFLGLAALFAGPLLRRALAFLGRAEPAPWPLALLELTALSGLLGAAGELAPVFPVALRGHAAGGLLALLLALPPAETASEEDRRASLIEEALVLLLALAALWVAPGLAPLHGALALEAWGPRAPRTGAAAARRVSAFGLTLGLGLVSGLQRSQMGFRTEDAILPLATVAGLIAGAFALARLASRERLASLGELTRWAGAWGEGRGRCAAWVASVALGLVFLLATGLLPFKTTQRIAPNELGPGGGHEFLARTELWGSDQDPVEDLSTLEVLEDRRPLGPAHSTHTMIRERGRGRFSHWNRVVHLSSSDGSDPRTNGCAYEIRRDLRAPAWLVLGLWLAWLLLNGRRIGSAGEWLECLRPGVVAGILVVLALIFRIEVAWRYGSGDVGGLVHGVPFSDAHGWDALATDFADGVRWNGLWQGWSGRRPFFWIFMGSIYAWTGASFHVACAVHLVLGALSTGIVFDLVRRLGGFKVALLVALAQAFDLFGTGLALAPLTEQLGEFLGDLSLWAFVMGAERLARGERSALWLGASGLALGLSNLTRTLTLAAVAGEPLLGVLVLRGRVPRRRLLALALIAVGCGVALAPWLVRQKVVHGIALLSDNSAEMLYGATTPEYGGSWTPEVSALSSAVSVRERFEFYTEGSRRNVREHFAWYLGNLVLQARLALQGLGPPHWLLLAGTLGFLTLGLAPGLERPGVREGRLLLAALGLLGLALWLTSPIHYLALAGIALVLVRRHPLALLLGSLLPTVVLLGVMAGGYDRRFTHALEWSGFAFVFSFIEQAFRFAGDKRLDPVAFPRQLPGWGGTARAVRWAAAMAIVFWLGGLGRAIAARVGSPALPAVVVAGEEAHEVIARALEGEAAERYAFARDRLVVARAPLRRGYMMRFEANEEVGHWSPIFAPRPYAWTLLETRPDLPGTYAVFPGDPGVIEADEELVFIGVIVPGKDNSTRLELVALGRRGGREWLRATGSVAPVHARELAERLERQQ